MTAFAFDALNGALEGAAPEVILDAALQRHPTGLAFACSLGLEDMALLHLIRSRDLPIRAFVLDTGRLHPETLTLLARAQRDFGPVEVYVPDRTALEAYVNGHGLDAFYESLELRRACCAIRKVEPLQRALEGATGWITGQRRAQSTTRTALQPFEQDWAHGGLTKVNPLAFWSLEDAEGYVDRHAVPVNPLHARGFPSIGCAPCTRAIQPGEDPRAGRWWWEHPEHKECGLHPAKAPR
ncbi:MAG TPA: phosphoadenylyl-sulfate reductase [Holophagaceae bacterium]|nr:phosphoadenylyl-sulfate reductase [Holophagaceae bacterium]